MQNRKAWLIGLWAAAALAAASVSSGCAKSAAAEIQEYTADASARAERSDPETLQLNRASIEFGSDAGEFAAEAAQENARKSETNVASAGENTAPKDAVSGALTEAEKTEILKTVPAYSGEAYTAVHDNVPFFSETALSQAAFESYSMLDALGRCGSAYAMVGTETMPTQARGSTGHDKPVGWHSVKYDSIDGGYLYNACHLIGFQLTGENANAQNLITGTRYLNIQGMLPFENMIADYIKETGNHVLYRVTPIYDGENLLASGVLMEAESAEDRGEAIQFCAYAYNVQPGIEIDYQTGESRLAEGNEAGGKLPETLQESGATAANAASGADAIDSAESRTGEIRGETGQTPSETAVSETEAQTETTYILNKNSKKFHRPSCSSAAQMKEENQVIWEGTRDEVLSLGYEPCKRCNP